MELPDDCTNDNPEQKKERMRRSKEEFISRWKNHANSLDVERRETIYTIIKNGSWVNLINSTFPNSTFPNFNNKKQVAIWNGNPYACGVKEPWEIYEDLHPIY